MKSRTLIASVGALGVAGGGLALLSPNASARELSIGDGAASVTLGQCNDGGKPQSTKFMAGCSYTALQNKSGTTTTYTFVGSNGEVKWNDGTITSGALAFRAADQTWPPITGLPLSTVSSSTPSEITGSVDLATGKVTLNLKVDTLLTSGSGSTCTITGDVTLTSEGTESLGNVATGENYDPATGKFAVVSTTPAVVSASGNGCGGLNALYDVSKGMGYYITGGMTLPGGVEPTPDPTTPTPDPTPEPQARKKQKPLKALNLPKKLARTGSTRIVKVPVRTNAGQKARVRVVGKVIGSGAAGEVRPFRTYKRAGAVWVELSGTRATKVRVTISAPRTEEYNAYRLVKVYRTKAVGTN